MAQDMFSRWDKEIDTEGLQNDIAEAATNGGNGTYKEAPHGVSDGDYKGSILFYNQVITQGFQIHNCNELLRKMVEEMGADMPVVEFKSYKQYSELLMDIYEAIADNFEYALKYTANKKNKDFSDFEVTEVFILE